MKTTVDELSRLVGVLEGEYDNSYQKIKSLRLLIICGEKIAHSSSAQAALLTAINTGKRCFLGGVFVLLKTNTELLLPWHNRQTISDTITELEGKIILDYDALDYSFCLSIGCNCLQNNSLEVVANGWIGGVKPYDSKIELPPYSDFALGGVAAAAIGVGQAFLYSVGLINECKTEIISLLEPEKNFNEFSKTELALNCFPKNLWILGLGHLGQSYLWTFSFMPIKDCTDINICLQDFDSISLSNYESGLLTDLKYVGKSKTRVCSDWLEERKFSTRMVERRFDSTFTPQSDEPRILLSGLDNLQTRQILDPSRYDLIIDCGLGGDISSFDSITMRVFPNIDTHPTDIWSNLERNAPVSNSLSQKYQEKLQCGYFDKGISSSFVGALASSLVIAELLKAFNGGTATKILSLSIRNLEDSKRAIVSEVYTNQVAMAGFIT